MSQERLLTPAVFPKIRVDCELEFTWAIKTASWLVCRCLVHLLNQGSCLEDSTLNIVKPSVNCYFLNFLELYKYRPTNGSITKISTINLLIELSNVLNCVR